MIKRFIYLSCISISLFACKETKTFHVEGLIAGAKDRILYLEASTLNGVQTLDSLKLDEKGKYDFKSKAPDMPEYYRLRIDNRIINFLADSTETIKIDASYQKFTTDYSITGDKHNQTIKELSQLLIGIQNKIINLSNDVQKGRLLPGIAQDSLTNIINGYKTILKEKYIYPQLNNPIAYYALFQRLNGSLLFDPDINDDSKVFAAVATSMQLKYPDNDRTKNICNIALKSMREKRLMQANETPQIEMNQVEKTGIIDINLRDLNGNIKKLSDLKGKVVLLDFTIYQGGISTEHNFVMGDLYKKFADKGFQIYQVSLDNDVHFWKTAADKLPWICVHDPSGANSAIVRTYNIQTIPTMFLIDRNNELKQRFENTKGLEQAIEKLL